MAKQIVVAIRDSAAVSFVRPWTVPARGMAVRGFTDEVNRRAGDNTMNQHPEDYELWYLAQWDEETGAFSFEDDVPQLLVRGKDVIKGDH